MCIRDRQPSIKTVLLKVGSSFGEKQVLLRGDFPVVQTQFFTKEHTDVYVVSRQACRKILSQEAIYCLLYTSDAADDLLCVDLGGRRVIKKKKKRKRIEIG
eukprot:TRINITY_DN15610_c0_g1_i1.p2 TRINITY_DN15610_c0_g1~~TRINITY_DN15610_c0_g1_i1.p2  ORF type:complete len:101 (+),score=40.93 TRINITY_DN15610_c0_g1_i1:172-474(+)